MTLAEHTFYGRLAFFKSHVIFYHHSSQLGWQWLRMALDVCLVVLEKDVVEEALQGTSSQAVKCPEVGTPTSISIFSFTVENH